MKKTFHSDSGKRPQSCDPALVLELEKVFSSRNGVSLHPRVSRGRGGGSSMLSFSNMGYEYGEGGVVVSFVGSIIGS